MSQITLQALDFLSVGTPSVGDFIFGVDVDGIPKLKRNGDILNLYATPSTSYYPTTFNDFNNYVNGSTLIPGGIYVIADFQTRHYIQYTDSIGDGTGGSELVNVGSTEPLAVLALSPNTYNSDVKSLSYPDDEIKWKHNLNDREFEYANNPSGVGKGHILYRKSLNENSRDYDFRNVVFRRWNDGTGTYSLVMKIDAINHFDYIDYYSFQEVQQPFRKNEISSIGTLANNFGVPYYLDNIIISTFSTAFGNYLVGHGVTFEIASLTENRINLAILSDFRNPSASVNFNQIDSIMDSNFYCNSISFNQVKSIQSSTFSSEFVGNISVNVTNSTLGDVNSNKINTIDNSNIISLYDNIGDSIVSSNIGTVSSNSFVTIISSTMSYFFGNVVDAVQYNNVATMSGNIANTIVYNQSVAINNNMVDTIQNNVISGQILNNNVNEIVNNSGTGSISGNTSKIINDNLISGDISDNIIVYISDNSTTNQISDNIGLEVNNNTCGLIRYNDVVYINNNTFGTYSNNLGDTIMGNSFSYCSQNEVYTINHNSLYQVSANVGYSIDSNTGSVASISNNQVYVISGNLITASVSYNSGSLIQGNNVNTITKNDVNRIISNTASHIVSNKSISISNNIGGDIGTNSVHIIGTNSNFSYIGYNNGNQLIGNTFNSTYSYAAYNNFALIANNTNCQLVSNNINTIVNNNVNIIRNNNFSNISNNYNIFQIGDSSGHTINSVTGSTGSYYLQINQVYNAELFNVILNGSVNKHTFLNGISNLSLTPSTNMQSGSYSTISKYLFDLGGYYEEITNSTGLTYSDRIA